MKLIECYIENFGTFERYECKFNEGLNCFISDNGTGKTTLSMFILSMLYGIPDTKKQSLDENERKKYFPWQGGRFGGTLTLEINGKEYVIERSFGTKASDDTFVLYERESGKESKDFTDRLGEEVFGIDRDGFMRTVFLSEKNLSVQNENKSISAKLSDLVGVDGDIGGYDEAKKRLDDIRKIYYKQSGNCEIARVKAQIRDKRDEYDRLKRLGNEVSQKEKELNSIKTRLNEAQKERSSLTEAIVENARLSEKQTVEKQYIAMLEQIKEKEAALKELEDFFSLGVPTLDEIARTRFSLSEAEKIKSEEAKEIGGEYLALSEIYGDGISFEIISGAEKALMESRTLGNEINEIERGRDEVSLKMRELFSTYVPERQEVEKAIENLGKKKPKTKLLTTIVSILLLILGIVLGNTLLPALYLFTAIGAALLIFTLVFKKDDNGADKAAQKYLSSIGRHRDVPAKEALIEVLRDLDRYSELKNERALKLKALTERRDGILDMLTRFCDTFNIEKTADIEKDLSAIREGYTKYYKLKLDNESALDGRGIRLATAQNMTNQARDFLSRFKTVTDNPFNEIAQKTELHNLLTQGLEKDKDTALMFSQKYGTTGTLPESSPANDEQMSADLVAIEEKVSELMRLYGILSDDLERTEKEADRIADVECELSALEDRLTRYLEILETVQKTSQLMSEAYENMNSKYIGKTRESFLKYEEAIGGVGGNYTVKCDFQVQKSERGAMHTEQSYSRGTRDLISLSMRLALTDSLFEGEEPFIILDDPFIALDDKKIKKGKALLNELARKKQVIYFTCSDARKI